MKAFETGVLQVNVKYTLVPSSLSFSWPMLYLPSATSLNLSNEMFKPSRCTIGKSGPPFLFLHLPGNLNTRETWKGYT